MPIRPDLDRLHVVDIENVGTGPRRPDRRCARCKETPGGSTWSATYLANDHEPFTVILCGACWTATRERLEREAVERDRG